MKFQLLILDYQPVLRIFISLNISLGKHDFTLIQ